MKILAIETSFDETATAIVENGITVLCSVLSSSASLHKQFGGVLPELAARKQVDFIVPVIQKTIQAIHPDAPLTTTLEEIDAIAVTIGPGLIGSLLVGVEAAKTIALVTNKPVIPINHVHAHIYSAFIDLNSNIPFPAIALVVSGGHTELFFMEHEKSLRWISGTVDDAAGEAFDKTARLIGFENLGGVAIETAARNFRESKNPIKLPRPLLHDDSLQFSFSGLKTAVLRSWKTKENLTQLSEDQIVCAFAHEIQESITDVLVQKTIKASSKYGARSMIVTGGVAANGRLREKFLLQKSDALQMFFPKKELCTDNAVSIGAAAYFIGTPHDWKTITANPSLSVEI